MRRKITTDLIKIEFDKKGWKLSSKEYKNNKTKLAYICDKGHEHSITWSDFNAGYGCPYCAKNLMTIGIAKKEFEKENYILSSTQYKNIETRLHCICSNGHEYETCWRNWSSGARCPKCFGNEKLTIDFIREEFAKEGYILLSTEYLNNQQKLNYICDKGHKHSISWLSWKNGSRCFECYGTKKKTLEVVKPIFEEHKYELIDDTYKNISTPLKVKCPNGHKYKVTVVNFRNNKQRCPKCQEWGTSRFEQEVKDFVLSLNQEIIENDRTTILNHRTGRYLELDILFPCKTKAVECNGVYWHDRPEAIEKDEIKQKQCEELGIELFTLTDEEWNIDLNIKHKLIDFINSIKRF